MPQAGVLRPRLLRLRDHAELRDQIECLLDVQVERLQGRVDTNLVLVKALGLGDAFEGLDGAADEVRDVVDTCEDLGIRVALDELEQLCQVDLSVCAPARASMAATSVTSGSVRIR